MRKLYFFSITDDYHVCEFAKLSINRQNSGEQIFFSPDGVKQFIFCLGKTLRVDKWIIMNKFFSPSVFIVNVEFYKMQEQNKSKSIKQQQ